MRRRQRVARMSVSDMRGAGGPGCGFCPPGYALDRDHAAMHVGLEAVLAKCRDPGQVDLAAFLDVLQRAAGDAQILRRAGLAVTVEHARDERSRAVGVSTYSPSP